MNKREAVFLRVFAIWTFFVWGTFIRNMIGDDEQSTAFKTVHISIAIVSILLGIGCLVVVHFNRRRVPPPVIEE